MKKFFADFKKFISRGNVIDMAVGVIVAGAFSAIVTALTNKIIMPLINALLSIGGDNGLEKAYTFLRTVYASDGTIDLTKSIYIDWGAFITAIINFFIIAFVLFSVLRIFMKANQAIKEAYTESTNKELRAERKAVKVQAKAEGRKFKDAWKDYEAEKKRKAEEEKARIEAEEAAKKAEAEEQARLNSPEYLLKEIRDLLKEQKADEAVKKLETIDK